MKFGFEVVEVLCESGVFLCEVVVVVNVLCEQCMQADFVSRVHLENCVAELDVGDQEKEARAVEYIPSRTEKFPVELLCTASLYWLTSSNMQWE